MLYCQHATQDVPTSAVVAQLSATDLSIIIRKKFDRHVHISK